MIASLESWKDLLNLGWVSSLIGIVGIFLAVLMTTWTFLKSIKRPAPMATMTKQHLVGGPGQSLPSDINILYNNQPVSNITRTLVRFWNAGSTTLEGSAVATRDPLRFEYDDPTTKVLAANIVRVARDANGVIANINPSNTKRVDFGFDFMDRQEGAMIEIFHTGGDVPRVFGTFKGIPEGVRLPINNKSAEMAKKIFAKMWYWGSLVSGIGLIFLSLWKLAALLAIAGLFGILIGMILIVAAGLGDAWQERNRHPKYLND